MSDTDVPEGAFSGEPAAGASVVASPAAASSIAAPAASSAVGSGTGGPAAGPSRILRGADLTRERFLLNEMRIVCRLREEGLQDEQVLAYVTKRNPFQYRTGTMLSRIARACLRRIDAAGSPDVTHVIATGIHDAAAQANLFALMCANPLVRDFMVREVGRRLATMDYELGPIEMGAYMTRLQRDYQNVGRLSDSTIARIKTELRRCLVECGMLQSARAHTLRPALLDPDVREAIEKTGQTWALAAFGQIGG